MDKEYTAKQYRLEEARYEAQREREAILMNIDLSDYECNTKDPCGHCPECCQDERGYQP